MIEFCLIGVAKEVPELCQTQSGLRYCDLAVDCDRPYANADGEIESDEYSVRLWKQLAEDASDGSLIQPGKKYYIKGRIASDRKFINGEWNNGVILVGLAITRI